MYNISQISNIINLSVDETINLINLKFPNLIANGKRTLLTIEQVQELKTSTPMQNTTGVEVSTDDEMILKIKDVMSWLNSKTKDIENKLNIANEKILIDKPKVELYDDLMNINDLHEMKEVSDILKIGRNTLFAILREKKILNDENLPYSQYKEMKLFEVKIKPIPGINKNKSVTLATPKGIEYIKKLITKIK
jgi:phage antirepressor YoqD-like protein